MYIVTTSKSLNSDNVVSGSENDKSNVNIVKLSVTIWTLENIKYV